MEINETQGSMEVKIPGSVVGSNESRSKAISVIDIPGHLHYRSKIQEVLEEAKAVILVIDSKEK
jgi:GTPase SAR1 family protein